MVKADNTATDLFPQEARLRGLTYSAPVYVDINCKQFLVDDKRKVDILNDEPVKTRDIEKELLCYMPIMTRSSFCQLRGKNERELTWAGECTFDQGGYFIINGSEKVIIAQERMSNNHVYVFKKQQPHKYEWVCETRFLSLEIGY